MPFQTVNFLFFSLRVRAVLSPAWHTTSKLTHVLQRNMLYYNILTVCSLFKYI